MGLGRKRNGDSRMTETLLRWQKVLDLDSGVCSKRLCMLKWPKQKTGCYVHFSAAEKKWKSSSQAILQWEGGKNGKETKYNVSDVSGLNNCVCMPINSTSYLYLKCSEIIFGDILKSSVVILPRRQQCCVVITKGTLLEAVTDLGPPLCPVSRRLCREQALSFVRYMRSFQKHLAQLLAPLIRSQKLWR